MSSTFLGMTLVEGIIGVAVFIIVVLGVFSCVSVWSNQNSEKEALKGFQVVSFNLKTLLADTSKEMDYRRITITLPKDYFIYGFNAPTNPENPPSAKTRFIHDKCKDQTCICLFHHAYNNYPNPADIDKIVKYNEKNAVQCEIISSGNKKVVLAPSSLPGNIKDPSIMLAFLSEPVLFGAGSFISGIYSNSMFLIADRKPGTTNLPLVNDPFKSIPYDVVLGPAYDETIATPSAYTKDTFCPSAFNTACGTEGFAPSFDGSSFSISKCLGTTCQGNTACFLERSYKEADPSNPDPASQSYLEGSCLVPNANKLLEASLSNAKEPLKKQYKDPSLFSLAIDASMNCGATRVESPVLYVGILCQDKLTCRYYEDVPSYSKDAAGQWISSYDVLGECS